LNAMVSFSTRFSSAKIRRTSAGSMRPAGRRG